MSDEDVSVLPVNLTTNAPAWQAPPLTVTASSSPTDHRNIRRAELDSENENEKSSSRDASQSRISDHIEIPKGDDKHDPKDGYDGKRRSHEDVLRNRRNARLLQSPGLKWHKEYSDLDQQAGRVLMIDFARSDKSRSHIRKVAAQEIFNLQTLRQFCRYQSQDSEPAMRVIHVQNADWAVPFLMRKFDISAKSHGDGSGMSDFGRYLRYKNPELRGGKPFLAGKTWKVTYDPWRRVNKTSFGVDYMKSFRRTLTRGADGEREGGGGRDRMMQLNDFDENDEPICGHDVFVQRLSCYIQHKQAPSENRLSRDDLPLRKHFYPPDVYRDEDDDGEITTLNGALKDKLELHRLQRLRHLDNGNVIIIFDNSSSGNIDDTLIPARRDLECRWRRLPFHLAFESRDPAEDDDAKLALNCSKAILSDIFKAVVMAWDAFLDHAVTHMTILEGKIYERPDDESRAPELWENSSAWLKVEKLVNVHASVMQQMKTRLHELTDDVDTEDNWLEDSPSDFERLTNLITEDLTKPTESLISLLYQSVSIRDSRHSLELGVSMWRLSWITFIFLPLTFIVGFFGMNVDTFSNNPSIKWYFIAAIPFMFGVLTFYFLMKGGSSDSRRRSPHERIVYETFFQEMANRNPILWSRNGPRDYVHVEGRLARLKWSLIKHWLRPVDLVGSAGVTATTAAATTTTTAPIVPDAEGTISNGIRSALIGGGDGLNTLSRMQRYLSRRWTAQIANNATATTDTEMGLINMNDDEFEDLALASGDERLSGDHHSIGEGLTEVAEVLAAAAVPRAGRPGLWTTSSAPSSLDHEHEHEHEYDHDSHDDHDEQQHVRTNIHLTVPGTGGKGLWTPTATSSTNDHTHGNDNEIHTDDVPTTAIPNAVIAAAITRDRARQLRLRSSSSPSPSGRGRGQGARARGGSGSSAGGGGGGGGSPRNSDRVLVEEEDAEWLNERGRKGKDWMWRFGGSNDDKEKDNKEGRSSGSESRGK
ncbi:hypothetical protein TMatcc_009768 [Talaromyces marneffei ATCC 18224]|uniref:CorA family metal ion transporter n=1 Tax=Talaromyces marneffei (strain ATCC 18224 / CBS 334.59 / QM 7333) TaxID=441960 RepID=B6QT83_TALMQ|nr:conserved hypothetical protein [Talaromyces marneffei ATCC 18224]